MRNRGTLWTIIHIFLLLFRLSMEIIQNLMPRVGLVDDGLSGQLPLSSLNSVNSMNSMNTPQSVNQGYPVNQENSTNPPVSYPSIHFPSNAPQLLSAPSLSIPPMDLPVGTMILN